LDISQVGVGDIQGDCEEVSALLVGFDSLFFGESLQIKGLVDLVEQVVAELNDSVDSALVGQLFSSGGDGCQGLEDFSP